MIVEVVVDGESAIVLEILPDGSDRLIAWDADYLEGREAQLLEALKRIVTEPQRRPGPARRSSEDHA
ncbi:MAG TPA: hypothetical protein VGB99_12975 [Acidobacteriota bacterium]